MVVDLGVTFALLSRTHYLVANLAGFALAVSHNFTLNWSLTYGRPEGSILKKYLSYVSLHGATFALRAGTIALLVSGLGVPASFATLVGVGVAAIANYAGTETIFGGAGEVWFDVVEAANHVAHLIYSSRLRGFLYRTGLYDPIFRLYSRGLSLAYRAPERHISVAGATATVSTEHAIETVSVLHTLEKEREILSAFLDDVESDDHVLDVGANLGLFSVLSGQQAKSVTAVEPHPPTAAKCKQNLERNGVDVDVVEAALGAECGVVSLAVDQDAVGTQRPEVAEAGGYDVPQYTADSLDDADVVKIDVEGLEHDVLDGMAETLDENPPRVIYAEAHSEHDGDSLETRLEARGYDVSRLAATEQVYLRGVLA